MRQSATFPDSLNVRAGEPPIGRGFSDPVMSGHKTFRSVMMALAEPATVHLVPAPLDPPSAMSPAMAAIGLSLADFETALWMDAGPAAQSYFRFHTGAQVVSAPLSASFGLVTKPTEMPELKSFAQGTLEYPDRSTTILIDVAGFDRCGHWRLTGPGIRDVRHFSVSLPDGLTHQIVENRTSFPRGVDLIFCMGNEIAALPRSTRIDIAGG